MHLLDLTQFLHELEENNNRAWFVMNKPRYDILRIEFLELVTEIIAGVKKFDPALAGCDPKKCLFRINRDLRFGHNKAPYKTWFSAAMIPSGLKKPSDGGGPAYYFHINAEGVLRFGAGEYSPPKNRVLAIRQQIVADSKGFAQMLKHKSIQSVYDGLLYEDALVRPPKGFDPDDKHIDEIKLKSYFVRAEKSTKKIKPAELPALLTENFKAAWPLVKWLRSVPFDHT